MKGPRLGPSGEDITWPDQVAPRGRKASSTRKLKPQTSNLYTQVKYVGHILHEGQRSTAPGKVAAVRELSQDIFRTPKQIKNFLGICNRYSIYISNYASLAEPVMVSLAGKYKHDPEKRTSKVPAHKQTISWTHLMRENFEKIKNSPCDACSLYIPSDQGQFAVH